MKLTTVLTLVGGLALLVAAVVVEGVAVLLFGWVPFLQRVGPQVSPDGPSLVVGGTSFLLFAVGVHWLGRARRPWRAIWTVTVVLAVVFLFAAGIAVVGITHQLAWLATSDRPLRVEALARNGGHPANTAREIGFAMVNYSSSNDTLPPGGTFSSDGKQLHGWETPLLPFIGYSAPIDMIRPWTDPKNQAYFRCVLPPFINPGFRTPALEDGQGFGLSHYAVNSRVLSANRGMKVHGPSNTLLVGEVNAGFKPWGHPVNWRDPSTGFGPTARQFGGLPGANGVTFVMADGSVRFISHRVSPEVLRVLSTPAGGEAGDMEAITAER